jgi:hypothetical protein
MMAHATIPGSDIYGWDWEGPLSDEISIFNMSDAILGLTAAIGPDETATPPPVTGKAFSGLKRSAIIGITFAGIFALLSSAVAVLIIQRWRRHKKLVGRAINPLLSRQDKPDVPQFVADEKVYALYTFCR